jgi:potassium efflux system protein
MKYHTIRILPVILFTLLLAPALSGQNPLNPFNNESNATKDTTVAPILPFPVSGILDESSSTEQLVNEAEAKRLTEADKSRMITEVDSLVSQLDPFLNDTLFKTFEGLSTLELDNTGNRAKIYQDIVAEEQSKLSSRVNELQAVMNELNTNGKRWELTRDQTSGEEIPGALMERIDLTIQRIDSVRTLLQDDINLILLQQDRLVEKKVQLDSLIVSVQETRTLRSGQMFSRDKTGFFKDLSSLKEPDLIQKHTSQLLKSLQSDAKVFKSEFSGSMVVVFLFFIGLLVLLYSVRKNHTAIFSTENIKLTKLHLELINAPLLIAIFTVTIVIRLAFPDLPYTFRSINSIILIIPMVILAIRIFGSGSRRWMIWLIIIFVFSILFELLYFPDILQRIFLLFLSTAGMFTFMWIVLLKPAYNMFQQKSVYKLMRTTGIVFTVLLFIAIVANLVGAFSLAEFLTMAPIQIAFLTLIIKLITSFVDIILYLVLASKYLLKVNSIREYSDQIHDKASRLVNLFLWLFYLVSILRILRIKQIFFDWGHKLLTNGRTIGEVDITLKSILIFVFVIWLSLFISKMVRYILEKDVFVRVTTSKGVPGTITMLVRVALITFGFMLAAAAAGMELTNLSIVLGAFSVGIGFGLQNIFNNMVSGLILSFERPINVGDVVQVGELMGTVLNIGLRASRIKSFDGAEVIVPNGNLISDSLINWTLSDANRRMDIRVGVAYGTDPELVLRLMEEAAEENPKVWKDPSPKALFLEFGDSSLNFRLLAWTQLDFRLEAESEVKIVISRKLKEAGIEIPFPQRDLHIRSDATKIDVAGPGAKSPDGAIPGATPGATPGASSTDGTIPDDTSLDGTPPDARPDGGITGPVEPT